MNPDEGKDKVHHTFSDEELDELLKEDEELEDLSKSKQSHIEDLDELTPEELQSLKNYLEATKLNTDIAKWLSDLSIRYNQPFTPIMEKREIENLIRRTLGQFDSEFTERVIAKMKRQNKTDEEIDKERSSFGK